MDLLAQIEAQHRAATRLERTARLLSTGVDLASPLQRLHEHMHAIRELFEGERTLLEELERMLGTVNS
jgi:uncharacterized protein YicC (UPF0701 family)